MKVADTPTLLKLDAEAVAHGFSRQVAFEKLEIDPEGKHLLNQVPVFQPFARCMAFIKVIGQVLPIQAFMDITQESYCQLEDATTNLKALEKIYKLSSYKTRLDEILERTSD